MIIKFMILKYYLKNYYKYSLLGFKNSKIDLNNQI